MDGKRCVDRRDFLAGLCRTGFRLASLPALLSAMGMLDLEALAGPGFPGKEHLRRDGLREVEFYTRLPGGDVQCGVCPLECVLSPGETSECRTKQNHDGRLLTHAYNNPCILRVDPVEKLPLHHYMPETRFLSVAVGGCNMRCLYCQNWQQSQVRPEDLDTIYFPRSEALKTLRKKKREKKSGVRRAKRADRISEERPVRGLGFTYTEPVVFAEYLADLAACVRPWGFKTVVATSLFIKKKPLRELLKHVDAMAIGLKGFRERYYETVIGRSLAPVLDAIEVVAASGIWFELTTLIVPTCNDGPKEIRDLCRWVRKNLGTDIPLHFSRFTPMYRLQNLPRTPVATLETARKIALDEGIRFVYCSNIAPHEGNHTYCPACGKPLIERLGFKVLQNRLRVGTKNASCPNCGSKIPGVWNGKA
jgi:pyruvate formate lyase activating enzyme